ncbi:hypothetical protein TcasGA2_TC032008 [Tribolium castaneum]|uniref:Uncharacterized protein n=1 Tax=Tribolium castaneum TaxID=7070 RepID=A0A139WNL2_TRICA|nr:PREDICTED: uncharacterized protein LOC103315024 [Tribolium castaneum]KYB29456.1 hypothetical protein TcasGA2_TC032008 [Tribolium castaneum]|eukprot:XP_008200865.1 PREDICTED: uncharacterized protein LOC103315024 [Tribolium castaneum]
MDDQKNSRIFRMQPILCPWITSQPYHSSLCNKNRASNQSSEPTLPNRFLNNPWINKQMPLGMPRSQDKQLPSIQQSSSQFFYFLRLMQLFPDTHPATLHTVLVLCKNDFFCAVDKMLYAKRCKLLCYKKNLIQKTHQNRRSLPIRINQISKKQTSCVTTEKKTDETSQDVPERNVLNSFVEKAEDLSTINKTSVQD